MSANKRTVTIKIQLDNNKTVTKGVMIKELGGDRTDNCLETRVRDEHNLIMTYGYQYETDGEIVTVPPSRIKKISTKIDWEPEG
jgi:hypothetical protein